MKNILSILFISMMSLVGFLLPGCSLIKPMIAIPVAIVSVPIAIATTPIAVGLEYALQAALYDKDVSNEPRAKHIMGRQFKLIKSTHLYKYKDQLNKWFIGDNLAINAKSGKIADFYADIYELEPGTRFKIVQVQVKASGIEGELCSQYIIAETERGSEIIKADVTSLFTGTSHFSDEPWNFEPKPGLIIEIEE